MDLSNPLEGAEEEQGTDDETVEPWYQDHEVGKVFRNTSEESQAHGGGEDQPREEAKDGISEAEVVSEDDGKKGVNKAG